MISSQTHISAYSPHSQLSTIIENYLLPLEEEKDKAQEKLGEVLAPRFVPESKAVGESFTRTATIIQWPGQRG